MQPENRINKLSPVPKLNRNSINIVLWNLFPVFGVLFLGWEPISVFVCYAMETIVIGIFNVFRLLVVYRYGLPTQPDESGVSGLGIIPFFIVHYFFFVFIQLSFFLPMAGLKGSGPLSVFHNIGTILTISSYRLALGVFVLSNISAFINDFVVNKKYETRSMGQQMFAPYSRIFVQQFVVILGSFIFEVSKSSYPVLILFVLVKIYFDLLFNGLTVADLGFLEKQKQPQS